ncbi:hypothetical protein COU95_00120 [Candidatus Shapirobacteria bacterium CG10_big_fil_rev_8_21_14_0_10_40_9]|uniref:DUF4446 domain-containing protein n=1 Tax=Candidatus Shapirobacteria bacterium CG10_big_fil_rev_8_21_14_0_10_40_9 TaxID=1974888 RepID=A0A2M8L4N9_9BACT|nr:MAG: hypothetical protein COU95_00120 [Candidatus Shapirobacteria bacterium CG10_big_fil_rev_8_21_14_0_10_40_9]
MLLNQEVLLVLFGALFIWLGALSFFLFRAVSHYRKLTTGVTKGDLGSILEKILKEEKESTETIDKLLKRIEGLEKDGTFHVQKTGLVRFNPFSDTGGSHSFALAILDGRDDGIVISSLHSRDQTRIYSKPVKSGKPVSYEFSKEEKEAIGKAQKH